jgi:hypothetical protein
VAAAGERSQSPLAEPYQVTCAEAGTCASRKFELHQSVVDLDERAVPLGGFQDQVAARLEDDDAHLEVRRHRRREQVEPLVIGIAPIHGRNGADSVAGRSNAGNMLAPNVVISTRVPWSNLNTSRVLARNCDSPHART